MRLRSILRQRLSLLALLAAPFFFVATAGAVQITIETTFVHRNNRNCVATDNGHGVLRFRCPPIPTNVTCATSVPSCNGGSTTLEIPSLTVTPGSNDRIAWSTGPGTNFNVTVPPETYIAGQSDDDTEQDGTPSLCKAIKDAMQIGDPSSTYSVSYIRSAQRFVISRTAQGGSFSLFSTDAGVSSVVQSINTLIGFTVTPRTGSPAYTGSTNVAITFDPLGVGEGAGNAIPSTGPCEKPSGVDVCANLGVTNGFGNISNEPHIEFDRIEDAEACTTAFQGTNPGAGPFARGALYTNYCNANIFLCASIGYGTNDTTGFTAIDELSFEVFKFQDGSNPLDEGSTPPQRTFFVDAPGALPPSTTSDDPQSGPLGPFCVLWDGAINVQGEFGKTNGQFGFRAKTKTNQTGQSGNVQITATRAYPNGNSFDADPTCSGGQGCIANHKPIVVDVTNVHVVRSSPTLVGSITAVPAQPYNITYRLSKDATAYLNINGVNELGVVNRVRTILTGTTKVGEGIPNGTLANGDSWNGRSDNGAITPPGNYLAVIQAQSLDQFGRDLSHATTRQIGLDPLTITDIRVQPLLEGATSLAVLDYMLTEPATAYIDVYPPGTQFCRIASNLNDPALVDNFGLGAPRTALPPLDFRPTLLANCAAYTDSDRIPPIKRIVEQKNSRTRVVSFWDGRDQNGTIVPDGDYVFVIYASLPSLNGIGYNSNTDRRVWTSQAKSGFLPVIRGYVGVSQVTPASSVIGSSPAVAGLNPFLFRYSLSRDAIVSMKIFNANGTTLVKTIVSKETRPGLFGNVERWDDGTDNTGRMVSSGTYLVQLTATDPQDPAKVSTTTALFPVDLFRITDIQSQPLLSGASDILTISYQLSQPMIVWLNIYAPGTIFPFADPGVVGQNWPPCAPTFPSPVCNEIQTASGGTGPSPVVSIKGLRAGRLKITEQWDGRDSNGLLVPDGQYVFSLTAQSTTTPNYFPTDRIYGTVVVQRGAVLFPTFNVTPDVPALFNSSATITLHPFTISYSLTRQSSVTIQVLNTAVPPSVVRTVLSGAVRQGNILLTDIWDGRDDRGNFPPAGFYIVRAVASDIASQLASLSTAQLTISHDPLRIYDVAVSPIRIDSGGSTIFYQVSEPMKVAVKIYRPGTTFDTSGNPSPPESTSLVKRIVGVKPARTEIQDVWDGTDLRLSLVPDGSYKFKIVASTDMRAIDDLTGNVLNPLALSLDRPIDEIPVVRNASGDPAGEFESNTFVYPNPITTAQATFQIYVPFQGRVSFKLFNIAGDLVYDRQFGEQAPSYSAGPLSFTWGRVNQSGRSVARGMYLAVIRVEETLGGKTVLQTVKKILIP